MGNWKKLDLTARYGHPEPEELVALRMGPKTELFCGSGERYEIGHLRPDPRSKSRKLWWDTGHFGGEDPVRMKKRYDIWWCPVPKYDGY